jgi:TonB family protein
MMRKVSLLKTAFAMVLAFSSPVWAQSSLPSNNVQIPVAGPNVFQTQAIRIAETLHLGNLRDWQSLADHSDVLGSTTEWILKGQTAEAWSEKITSRMMRNPSPMPPEQWVKDAVAALRAHCGKLEVLAEQAKVQTDPARAASGSAADYPTAFALVHCTDPAPDGNPQVLPKKHEVIWIKAMRGFHFGYLVQRTWHGDDLPADSVILSDKTRQNWQAWSDQVSLTTPSAMAATARLNPPTTPSQPLAVQANSPSVGYAALHCPQPILSTHARPPYPPLSMRLAEQGVTVLDVTIGDDGTVARDAIVTTSGSERLDQAAAEFVKANWRWQPPTPQCDRRTVGVSVSWNIKDVQETAQAAPPSPETLAQARRFMAVMGYAQSGEVLRVMAKLYEQRIFKTVVVSPNDRVRAREILLDVTTTFAHQYDEDLTQSLATEFSSRFNAQDIEDAIHFFEKPPGSLIAHHQILSAAEKQESGQAMLAHPKVMEVQMATINAMLHIGGTGIVNYQREREAKITRAFCAGLLQAHIAQSGCAN